MLDDAVLVALGSNLAGHYAGREALLEAALGRFADADLTLVKRSSWWRSASWPDPSLPDYLNGLALVETSLGPRETLAALRRLERQFGREGGPRNAPRTLDLDLIAHGRAVVDEPGLILPHPRAHQRLFVTGPLAEIAPDWVHPVLGETAARLAARATIGLDATPISP
ncbi:MAG TPA: 2-amino-4-hydroxy-6-hydroxymethyldihydropteridine diphosphokinase [Caulobacteraceae bacterium]|nr:2-amino-4-hydroxy-6-hydroxymethyldihydropteridine diphosphokinase [Caulobacteraceae bacterium]